jgi:predicted nucleic acid-binding Zn ribbon protein
MESISSILYSLYRRTPRHGEWVVGCLEGTWPKLLGERLASVCRPQTLKSSVLYIEVLDSAWQEALLGVKKDLEEKLRTATGGEVQRVRFMLCR